MNNERYNQIIDEAYENFINTYKSKNGEIILPPFDYIDDNGVIMSKEQFITNIKYDHWFSERWGLKIDERELTTVKERKKYDRFFDDLIGEYPEHHKTLDNRGVPRKIITITYKEEKIEVYE